MRTTSDAQAWGRRFVYGDGMSHVCLRVILGALLAVVAGCDVDDERSWRHYHDLARSPAEPATVYAVTAHFDSDTGLWRSEDDGESWLRLPDWKAFADDHTREYQVSLNRVAISPHDPSIVVIGDRLGRVYVSEDAASTWQSPFAFDFDPVMGFVFAPDDSDVIYAVQSVRVARSADRGRTFTLISDELFATPAIDWFSDAPMIIDPVRPSRWFASGGRSGLAISEDGGVTWRDPHVPDEPDVYTAPYHALAVLLGPPPPAAHAERALWLVTYQGLYVSLDDGETVELATDWSPLTAWPYVAGEHPESGGGPTALVWTEGPRGPRLLIGSKHLQVFGWDIDAEELVDLSAGLVRWADQIRALDAHPDRDGRVLAASDTTCKGAAAVFASDDAGDTWRSTSLSSPPRPPAGAIDGAPPGYLRVKWHRDVQPDVARAIAEDLGATEIETGYLSHPMWWTIFFAEDDPRTPSQLHDQFHLIPETNCVSTGSVLCFGLASCF